MKTPPEETQVTNQNVPASCSLVVTPNEDSCETPKPDSRAGEQNGENESETTKEEQGHSQEDSDFRDY